MNSNFSIVLQTVTIYLLIVASLRLFGKKELAQLSIIDLVFILLISNSVQNAMVGDLEDFKKGLLSAGGLFVINFMLKKILYKNEHLSKIVEGEPITLVYKGKPNQQNLASTQISLTELMAAIREHGVDSIEKVDLAVLEVDGNISVLSNDFAHRTSKKRKFHKVIKKQE
jgi:uncharacterized membrane protein YcaP (DUF421 family)